MAKLSKPVVFFKHGVARYAEDVEDLDVLEERGYVVVPDRDLPKSGTGEPLVVGKKFRRDKSDQDQDVQDVQQ